MISLLVLTVLVLQMVVTFIVVFILWMILNNQLIESAVHKFEMIHPNSIDQNLEQLTVVTFSTLNDRMKKRLSDCLHKELNHNINLIFKKDTSIKGGMVIEGQKFLIDYSLISRLKEGGIIR